MLCMYLLRWYWWVYVGVCVQCKKTQSYASSTILECFSFLSFPFKITNSVNPSSQKNPAAILDKNVCFQSSQAAQMALCRSVPGCLVSGIFERQKKHAINIQRNCLKAESRTNDLNIKLSIGSGRNHTDQNKTRHGAHIMAVALFFRETSMCELNMFADI